MHQDLSGFRNTDPLQTPFMGVEKGAFTLCNGTGHVDIPILGIQCNRHVLRDQVPDNVLSRTVEQDGLVGVPAEKDAMRGQAKDLFSPLNVPDIDGFVESP